MNEGTSNERLASRTESQSVGNGLNSDLQSIDSVAQAETNQPNDEGSEPNTESIRESVKEESIRDANTEMPASVPKSRGASLQVLNESVPTAEIPTSAMADPEKDDILNDVIDGKHPYAMPHQMSWVSSFYESSASVTDLYGVNDATMYQSDFSRLVGQDDAIETEARPLVTYKFMNIDHIEPELIDNAPFEQVVTQLSRSGSVENFDAEGLEAVALIRPSSPTLNTVEAEATTGSEPAAVEADVIEPEQEAEKVVINREELIQNIKNQFELKDRYKNKNLILQAKLSDYFRKKKADETRDTDKSGLDQEIRYSSFMNQINELRSESDQSQLNTEKQISDMQVKLEVKMQEIKKKSKEFVEYRKSIAVDAENSRTGKALPQKVIEQMEALEEKKESEVISVRLENIKLRNKLKRHEQMLRQKVKKGYE